MGREIRRVPPDWVHPQDGKGGFEPLFNKTFDDRDDPEWDDQPEWYRPAFESEPTHYQLYETVTEGTPMSPVFETKEELGKWMMANPDPVWGQRSRAAVDVFLEEEWSISMMVVGDKVIDGMEALVQLDDNKEVTDG